MASIRKRTYEYTDKSGRARTREVFRARYRDLDLRQFEREFPKEKQARDWLNKAIAAIETGTHVDPKATRSTAPRRAEMHLSKIKAHFGPRRLSSITPIQVKNWMAKLQEDGLKPSYIYALHGRLSQLYSDAMHDGLVAKSPCSRRTSPPMGEQVQYVATTAQVWALHGAMVERLQEAVLLGAFAGLRPAEVCGLRVQDVDLMDGVVLQPFSGRRSRSRPNRASGPCRSPAR